MSDRNSGEPVHPITGEPLTDLPPTCTSDDLLGLPDGVEPTRREQSRAVIRGAVLASRHAVEHIAAIFDDKIGRRGFPANRTIGDEVVRRIERAATQAAQAGNPLVGECRSAAGRTHRGAPSRREICVATCLTCLHMVARADASAIAAEQARLTAATTVPLASNSGAPAE